MYPNKARFLLSDAPSTYVFRENQGCGYLGLCTLRAKLINHVIIRVRVRFYLKGAIRNEHLIKQLPWPSNITVLV
jgi:hypothetical protein